MFKNSNERKSYEVGDVCIVEKQITEKDYQVFRNLSYDDSPIHSDSSYATSTDQRKCVAPLFLSSLPFSGLIGSGIPGKSALLLKSSISAIAPIFYGDQIKYSVRVVSKDSKSNILCLSAIGIRDADVVLFGSLTVKVRADDPEYNKKYRSDEIKIIPVEKQNKIIILGGSGEIGKSIVDQAIEKRMDLIITYNSNGGQFSHIKERMNKIGLSVEIFQNNEFINILKDPSAHSDCLSGLFGLVTLNSSPVNSSMSELLESNVHFNLKILSHVLPELLIKQKGVLINVGTSMMVRGGENYFNYTQAKIILHNYFRMQSQKYSSYGVEWITIAPDKVDTNFSRDVKSTNSIAPARVAQEVIDIFNEENSRKDCFRWVRSTGTITGDFGGFSPQSQHVEVGESKKSISTSIASENLSKNYEKDYGNIVREIIGETIGKNLKGIDSKLGIGQISGWDSARHLEVIMNIEQALDVEFSTNEYVELETIGDIVGFVEKNINK